MTKFKSFPLFNDVENVELRTWNRCAILFNILKDHKKTIANEYALNFSKDERIEIDNMFARIQEKGYSTVRAEVNRGIAS